MPTHNVDLSVKPPPYGLDRYPASLALVFRIMERFIVQDGAGDKLNGYVPDRDGDRCKEG